LLLRRRGTCPVTQIGRLENIKLANKVFLNIDAKGTGQLDTHNLSAYFEEYTETAVKIILNEIDLNKDGIITRGEWMAFWEYLRAAGYDEKNIRTSVRSITYSSNHWRKASRIWGSRGLPPTARRNPGRR